MVLLTQRKELLKQLKRFVCVRACVCARICVVVCGHHIDFRTSSWLIRFAKFYDVTVEKEKVSLC